MLQDNAPFSPLPFPSPIESCVVKVRKELRVDEEGPHGHDEEVVGDGGERVAPVELTALDGARRRREGGASADTQECRLCQLLEDNRADLL